MKTESHDYLSDVRQVAAIRSVVRDHCRRKWGTEKDLEAISQLELAVQEAAANIIEHAYKGRPDQSIQLVVELEDRMVSVSLYDQGLSFDAGEVEPPRFDGTRIGGFGLYMIRECVDEVRYSREADGRNVVRLVKRMGSRRADCIARATPGTQRTKKKHEGHEEEDTKDTKKRRNQ